MDKLITYENLRLFAYSSDALCTGPIRGIVVNFMGLGGSTMWSEDPAEALYFAKDNIVYITPYTDPWNWMNDRAIRYTDEVLDVLFEHYALPENTPIVSSGGSMGGLCGLVYTRYAKRRPAACVVNCPVCDLLFHYTERPDLPRTLYSAYGGADAATLQDAMRMHSPLHLAAAMPHIPYHIFHCEEDKAVNKQSHSDKLVARCRENGHNVTYVSVPGRGHCDLPDEVRAQYLGAMRKEILG